ncbi:hypothetical protein ACLB1S_24790 [Escherichia coli]
MPTLTVQRPATPTSLGWCDAWLWARQVVFAVESMLDDAATALGIDPVEIRSTPPAKEMLIRSRANVFTAQGCRSVWKAGKSLNGKTPCRMPEPARQFAPRRWRRLF